MAEVRLISPLPPDECLARVRAATAPENFWGISEVTRPVLARISGRSLALRKRLWYRNSSRTILSGTFEAHPEGTRFLGETAVSHFIKGFLVLWTGGWVLFGGVVFAASVGGCGQGNRAVGIVVPPLGLILMAGVVTLGRYIARGDAAFLTAFLTKLLDAREDVVPPTPGRGKPCGGLGTAGGK